MKLSILIPNYNNEKNLQRCIESVFASSYTDQLEVILVDDHSTDESHEIAQELIKKYPQLTYVRHERNMGCFYTVSTFFENVTGEFFHILGSDDIFLSEGLDKVFRFFNEFPRWMSW